MSLAVGFFDGVHLGHQAILSGASAALTFRNHPLTVLVPERAPHLIMSPEERIAAIRACGIAEVIMLDFTRELSEMSPEAFVEEFLHKRLGGRFPLVRCGANWRFGRGGAGDAAFLRAHGVEAVVVPYAEYQGAAISSSRIRACLESGAIEDANAMLGRRFRVSGCRLKGKGLGAKIGYPTINLNLSLATSQPSQMLNLPLGVYVVEVDGLTGIANYGLAPTMGEKAWQTPTLEIHFPSCSRDSLDSLHSRSELTVEFLRFVRSERKFDSLEDLRGQIARDCALVESCMLTGQDSLRTRASSSLLRTSTK